MCRRSVGLAQPLDVVAVRAQRRETCDAYLKQSARFLEMLGTARAREEVARGA